MPSNISLSVTVVKKSPNPSFVNGFAVATFPPRGKVSKATVFCQVLGLRALKLPPAGVNRNERRKEHILATSRTQSEQRSAQFTV